MVAPSGMIITQSLALRRSGTSLRVTEMGRYIISCCDDPSQSRVRSTAPPRARLWVDCFYDGIAVPTVYIIKSGLVFNKSDFYLR